MYSHPAESIFSVGATWQIGLTQLTDISERNLNCLI